MIYLVLSQSDFKIEDNLFIPNKATFHYLTNVRRVKNNEIVEFSNGKETIFSTKAIVKSKKETIFEIVDKKSFKLTKQQKITVLFSAVDFKVLEMGLKNGTEAGADKFIIISTDFAPQKKMVLTSKEQRFKSILFSASSQSRRKVLPTLKFSTFKDEIALLDKTVLNIVMHPYLLNNSQDFFKTDLKEFQNIRLWIGPEGGFSKKEEEKFQNNNFSSMILKTPILRTQNAVTVGTSFINHFLGE